MILRTLLIPLNWASCEWLCCKYSQRCLEPKVWLAGCKNCEPETTLLADYPAEWQLTSTSVHLLCHPISQIFSYLYPMLITKEQKGKKARVQIMRLIIAKLIKDRKQCHPIYLITYLQWYLYEIEDETNSAQSSVPLDIYNTAVHDK